MNSFIRAGLVAPPGAPTKGKYKEEFPLTLENDAIIFCKYKDLEEYLK